MATFKEQCEALLAAEPTDAAAFLAQKTAETPATPKPITTSSVGSHSYVPKSPTMTNPTSSSVGSHTYSKPPTPTPPSAFDTLVGKAKGLWSGIKKPFEEGTWHTDPTSLALVGGGIGGGLGLARTLSQDEDDRDWTAPLTGGLFGALAGGGGGLAYQQYAELMKPTQSDLTAKAGPKAQKEWEKWRGQEKPKIPFTNQEVPDITRNVEQAVGAPAGTATPAMVAAGTAAVQEVLIRNIAPSRFGARETVKRLFAHGGINKDINIHEIIKAHVPQEARAAVFQRLNEWAVQGKGGRGFFSGLGPQGGLPEKGKWSRPPTNMTRTEAQTAQDRAFRGTNWSPGRIPKPAKQFHQTQPEVPKALMRQLIESGKLLPRGGNAVKRTVGRAILPGAAAALAWYYRTGQMDKAVELHTQLAADPDQAKFDRGGR